MRNRSLILIAVLLAGSWSIHSAQAKQFKIFFLGGQSNMDGYGYTKELPSELSGEIKNVRIFCGNPMPDGDRSGGRGIWSALKPGYGVGFKSDGKENSYSDRFGPELTFGQRMQELYPDDNLAIIKYSRGGTSIDPEAPNAKPLGCWDPDFEGGEGAVRGINQFDHFVSAVEQAFAARDIDGDGEGDELIPVGIAWMQGESDAFTEPVAKRYEANLKKVIDRIRHTLNKSAEVDLVIPVVIGKIADSGHDADGKMMDFLEVVQEAQATFVKADPRAALVSDTSAYKFSDDWHYDTAAYLDLGRRFAISLESLSSNDAPRDTD